MKTGVRCWIFGKRPKKCSRRSLVNLGDRATMSLLAGLWATFATSLLESAFSAIHEDPSKFHLLVYFLELRAEMRTLRFITAIKIFTVSIFAKPWAQSVLLPDHFAKLIHKPCTYIIFQLHIHLPLPSLSLNLILCSALVLEATESEHLGKARTSWKKTEIVWLRGNQRQILWADRFHIWIQEPIQAFENLAERRQVHEHLKST